MDPNLLEPDELKIECELRNIRGLQSVQFSMLKLSLENEAKGEEEEPKLAHLAALKNPKREVASCAKKLVDIQETLVEFLKSNSVHKPLILNSMITRVRHYHSRLLRISNSPSVVIEYPPVFKLCEDLLALLDAADLNDNNLNESITNIQNLDSSLTKSIIKTVESDEKLVETVSSNISTPTQTNTTTSANISNLSPEMIKQFQSLLQNEINDPSSLSQINTHNQLLNVVQPSALPHCSKDIFVNSNNIVPNTTVSQQKHLISETPVSSNAGMPSHGCSTDSQNIPINSESINQLINYLSSLNPNTSVSNVISPPTEIASQNSKIPVLSQPPAMSHVIPPNIPTSLPDFTQLVKFPPPIMSAQVLQAQRPTVNQVPNENLVNNPEVLDQLKTLLLQLTNTNPNRGLSVNPPSNSNDNPAYAPPLFINNVNPMASSPNFHNTQMLRDFSRGPQQLSYQDNKISVVHKWNLSFDGSREGLNVERFLYRVEANASSYNLPEYKLLTDIQYLLKGKALQWYWAYKEANRPQSWLVFRNALVRQFQDDRNDFDIRQTIDARKQRPNESFQDFFTAISELTLALSAPLRDLDLMLILHGNMRSGLKEKLAGRRFQSVTELFDECVYVENAWRQIAFVPERIMSLGQPQSSRPPQNTPQYISRPISKPTFGSRDVHEVGVENVSTVPQNYNPVEEDESSTRTFEQQVDVSALSFPKHLFEKVKCWNCGNNGHFFYRCPQELKHIFCRGCGQSDILFEYCSRCQENRLRGARAGVPTSQNHQSKPNTTPLVEEAATNTDPEFYRMLKRN